MAAAADAMLEGGYCDAMLGGDEAGVGGEHHVIEAFGERLSGGFDFDDLGFCCGSALVEFSEVSIDVGLGFRESGFGSFEFFADRLCDFHELELFVFERDDFFFVALDFTGEGGEFIVLFRLVLLSFEAADGISPGLDIELESLGGEVVFVELSLGGGDVCGVAGELVFDALLLHGQALEFLLEREDFLVAILEDEEGFYFWEHGRGKVSRVRRGSVCRFLGSVRRRVLRRGWRRGGSRCRR